jgi:hypothetical protein
MNSPATSALPTADAVSTCKNCGFAGAGRFCQQCGQRYDTHRITLPHLLHEVFHFFTHVEAGLLFTLRELVRRPGYMERDYLAGRQVSYQKPFSCFFLACTITALGQFAVRTLVLRWYGISDEGDEHFFRHYFSLLQAALLPLYTLITWAFFRRGRYNYAEVMVVVLYTLSLLLYMTLALNVLRLLWPHFDSRYVELPLVVLYNTLTYLRLYPEESRAAVITKSLLINCACFALAQVAQYAVTHLRGH